MPVPLSNKEAWVMRRDNKRESAPCTPSDGANLNWVEVKNEWHLAKVPNQTTVIYSFSCG